ncbi:MAG: hypothetical protein ACI9AT_000413 [Ulvibacter sp.]|jgi:hypothetical protein
MSKEKEASEIKSEFLNHVREIVDEWESYTTKTCKEKLEGVAFSIVATIDGSSAALPAFILAPAPHEEDKQYCIDNGEDYYPENQDGSVKGDIAGFLHDEFYQKEESN